jgi:transcriptional regulator with PAS, ATPase and Fis domain
MNSWVKEFPSAVTICDKKGIIIYMNDKSIETFQNDGGEKLIGKNVLDCHPEPSRTQLEEMLNTEKTNVYTIEKNGVKKLIYQTPFYENGEYKGFVEMSIEIPYELENFKRN